MGGSTFAIAFIPSYSQIGLVAPAILLFLRIIQGLALGANMVAPLPMLLNMPQMRTEENILPIYKRQQP